ncbi:MAG: SDR family NAD(P)-dependent oxidoreductase [Pseudomonadota bacterium]
MSETRAALISGGNRGIGLEIGRQLMRAGYQVALGARDPGAGQQAADAFAAEGLEPAVVPLDVTYGASAEAAVAETYRLFGRIDVLVNNAGILIDRPTEDGANSVARIPIDIVNATFQTNTIGALRLTQACLPVMQAAGYGRIVNMSSGLGQLSDMSGGMLAYRMSKVAMNAMTATLAAELGQGPIKVNAMAPGWVRTDMGGANASRSVEEGADTAVWLAQLPEDGPTGKFFQDREEIAW